MRGPRPGIRLGRAVDPRDIYFLEATGETTLVRLRSSRRLREVRALGELVPLLAPFGVVRVHRNHAVNVHHVLDVRRRGGDADWEVKLEPPVNRVLPISRTCSLIAERLAWTPDERLEANAAFVRWYLTVRPQGPLLRE